MEQVMAHPSKKVAIFGAGIAGLTVAHELARRGWLVSVYEPNAEAGGFFRSARRMVDDNTPSEYSWHGMGPWYYNVFDLMKEIPFDESHSMYEKALSRPIDFGLAADDGQTQFDDTWLLNIKGMFRMTWRDVVLGSWLMLKTWVADRRSREHYSKINAAEAWRPWLSEKCLRIWQSSFGPWIGSDWLNVSLHTAGQFFHKQLITAPAHFHTADAEGPPWRHGARDGWLLLRGPSNEYWFNRWVKYLETLGVKFAWNTTLVELLYDGQKCTGARLHSGEAIQADFYVLAANPFAVAEVLGHTPALERQDQLRLFRPLVQDGPHIQVSLRIAFSEPIAWPRERAAIVVASSEFDLTLFAEEQVWDHEVHLGSGVRSLWTVTACVSKVRGCLYGKSVEECTKEQFIEEVKVQLYNSSGLNALIKEANAGRSLRDFTILRIEVWHEWQFSPEGIRGRQPKWVNRVGNQAFLPTQITPVENLALAGAHTRTDVDVWSIEAAVESGRRAAQVFEPSVKVLGQYRPWWLLLLRSLDNVLYRLNAPNVLDVTLIAAIVAGVLWLLCSLRHL
jgi:Flavin containing amine oxidoreductase